MGWGPRKFLDKKIRGNIRDQNMDYWCYYVNSYDRINLSYNREKTMSLFQPRECVVCKSDISMCVGQMRYCSRKCYEQKYYGLARQHAKESIQQKSCDNCGLLFMPKTRKATRFCSPGCIYDARLKRSAEILDPRSCEGCGQEFKPTRSFQMFCSPRCRNQITVLKRVTGMAAHEIHSLQAEMTIAQKEQQDADKAHREAIAKEINEQDLPLCSRCAINKVHDPEALYMQCPSCVLVTEAEEKAKQKCDHMYDSTNRCAVCGELNASV